MRTSRRISQLIPALAVLLAFAGCCQMDVGHSPALGAEVEEHVVASNYGWTLFGCIPVVCGNRNADSWCPFAFFCNDLKPEYLHDMVARHAEERNCALKDLQYIGDNDVLFDAYYAPVPWVIVYKEVNLSANLVKRGGAR